MMGVMVRNFWTSILGMLVGALTYVNSAGAKLPSNKNDWFAFSVGVALAALGVVAKDATTGSKPGEPGPQAPGTPVL